MPLSGLKEGIAEEAEAKAKQVEADGDEAVEKILAEASAKAEEILGAAKEAAAKDSKAMLQESEANAQIEADSLLLAAKEVVLRRELPKVTKQVADKIRKDYLAELVAAALSSFSAVASESGMIAEVSKSCEKMVKGPKKVINGMDDGAVFYSGDRSVRLDATVGSILSRSESELRSATSKVLFQVD